MCIRDRYISNLHPVVKKLERYYGSDSRRSFHSKATVESQDPLFNDLETLISDAMEELSGSSDRSNVHMLSEVEESSLEKLHLTLDETYGENPSQKFLLVFSHRGTCKAA